MEPYCLNRLTIVGPAKDLRRFYRDEHWMAEGGVRHFELLEHSPERHAWQFETDAPPLPFLRGISRQWPSLTFLLDYDCEDQRLKGLAKAKNGRVRHCRVTY
jgi:hypothetical protein